VQVRSGLELSTFGGFALRRGGTVIAGPRSRSATAMLVLLACRRRPHARSELATLFWPDRPDDLARTNVRSALYRIRSCIGDALVVARDTVSLGPEITVDTSLFEEVVGAGNYAAGQAIYRGPFLAGFHYDGSPSVDNWISAEAARYHELAMTACHAMLDRSLERGASDEVLRWARALLEIEPAHEPAHRAVMQVASGRGDRAAALHQYERAVAALRDELDMDPEAETTALAASIRAGRGTAATEPHGSEAESPHSVPPSSGRQGPGLAAFFGRERELELLHELLTSAERPVVVLVGPGGIGKSRLAREVMGRLEPVVQRCEMIDVAGARSAGDLGGTLARHLLPEPLPPGDPWQALAFGLARQDALVVVDSFEHLGEGAAELVELVRVAPRLRLVVTSRVSVDHAAVVGIRLGGLETEGPDLFAERARRRDPTFALEAEVEAVRAICTAVDNVPLAIELAASWTGVLPCSEIARELQRDAAGLLVAPGAASAERGMDRVFDRSWSLLSGDQRSALARLSVFPGSFSLEHAVRVAGAPAAAIRALADASLVHPTGDGRLRLHEVVRGHTRARLPEEHAELARSAHLDVAVERARAAFDRIFGAGQNEVDRQEDVQGDVMVALTWCLERPQHAGRYAVLLELACWMWRRYGRAGPALHWLERRPDDAKVDAATTAMLTYHRGHFLWMVRDVPEAMHWLRRALEEGEAAGSSGLFATSLAHSSMAMCHLVIGEAAEASPHATAAHRGLRAVHRPWFIALARGLEAWSLYGIGELTAARSAIEECLSVFRRLDNAWGLGLFLIRAAEIHLASGDVDRSLQEARESVDLLERVGFLGALPEARALVAAAEQRSLESLARGGASGRHVDVAASADESPSAGSAQAPRRRGGGRSGPATTRPRRSLRSSHEISLNVSVRLLGPPVIVLGEKVHHPESSLATAALYYLAYRGEWVARDELLTLFWPEADAARARASLRQLIAALRASPLAAGLEVERQRLRWPVPTDLAFPPNPADGPSIAAGALLEGFLLPGAAGFDEWLKAERVVVVARRRCTLGAEIDALVAARDESAAMALLEAWLDAEPLDEAMLARYLELAATCARADDAMARFLAFERRLERELGLTPSEQILAAAGRLRGGARRDAGPHVNGDEARANAHSGVGGSKVPRRRTVVEG
jgi:DNA-binding SARP family transcriptional activator